LQPRARGSSIRDRRSAVNGVPRNKGNKEKWFPSKKNTVLPALPILQDLSPPVSAGRDEEKWFLEKKLQPISEPDLLTFLSAGPAEEE
jgi:hypothetical protein